ncbi:MAG TPA: hypothetical protein VKZ42_00630 [Flavobacteriaceae bacterium]|nr:hypothetical protein [Flavobacteriaceae bacterium]
MKNRIFLLAVLLLAGSLTAQEFPKNEIKYNIANTLAIASVEVGYEHFISYDGSIELEVFINDRINYHSEEGSRQFNTNSVKLGYNYYFGTNNPGSGFYLNPFVKYRFGDFEEKVDILSEEGEILEEDKKITTDMSGFIVGIGAGYKWNFSNSFVVALYGNIGRNFSDEIKDRFTAIEFYGGLGIGYRF